MEESLLNGKPDVLVDHVIFFNKCKEMQGIHNKMYQFRSTRAETIAGVTIMWREVNCWCQPCHAGNYTDCVQGSRWQTHDFVTPGVVGFQADVDNNDDEGDDHNPEHHEVDNAEEEGGFNNEELVRNDEEVVIQEQKTLQEQDPNGYTKG